MWLQFTPRARAHASVVNRHLEVCIHYLWTAVYSQHSLCFAFFFVSLHSATRHHGINNCIGPTMHMLMSLKQTRLHRNFLEEFIHRLIPGKRYIDTHYNNGNECDRKSASCPWINWVLEDLSCRFQLVYLPPPCTHRWSAHPVTPGTLATVIDCVWKCEVPESLSMCVYYLVCMFNKYRSIYVCNVLLFIVLSSLSLRIWKVKYELNISPWIIWLFA